MGIFGAAHGWGGVGKKAPLPKICHTYPRMMKLDTAENFATFCNFQGAAGNFAILFCAQIYLNNIIHI